MEKYGVLIDGLSFILSVRYFKASETMPPEFIQISKVVFDETMEFLKPWSKFQDGKIFNGGPEEAAYLAAKAIEDIRIEMKRLQSEITLNTFLTESTTALQAELDAKKLEYEALITPP